ncbi:MAG: SRPBCC domain-containing protein [Bacteroidota bacterium]|nr:SRPBCC domain-containing protein [Bacteroidota bacterium]
MSELIIKSSVTINAPVVKVWDALVNPQETKKYMFGCETVSDWKEGSELIWRGEYEGKPMDFVQGYIKTLQPEKFLAYTVIDPNNKSIPNIPENYLTVTYELISEGNTTVLNVTQGDYSKVAEGERRYKEADNNGLGWSPILELIKKQVEGN